jgi:hypothetical protein
VSAVVTRLFQGTAVKADRERVFVDSPRPRPLSIFLVVVANTLVFLAIAYFVLGRGDLPSFFPHGAASPHDPDTRDVPMGLIALFLAASAAYGAHYAQRHRSWMRTKRWHRKHGRM